MYSGSGTDFGIFRFFEPIVKIMVIFIWNVQFTDLYLIRHPYDLLKYFFYNWSSVVTRLLKASER